MPVTNKDDIYYGLVREHYGHQNHGNVDAIVGMIAMSDTMAPRMLRGNPSIQTEVSPSGRLAIRWVEDNQKICLLGIISGDGKIARDDVEFATKQRAYFENQVAGGKMIQASVNDNTKPFLDALAKKLGRRQPPIDVKTISMGSQEIAGFGTWENILLCSAQQAKHLRHV